MPSSLKDMVQSVDWGKVFSNTDARNAAIGSALGGLMMGGAGLMAERDPEESRLAPVGDALAGALLGGVAGYGIPKGLAMFRDAGSLAPDGDNIRMNYLGAGGLGAVAGGGLFGLTSLRKTLKNEAYALARDAVRRRPAALARVQAALDHAVRSGAPKELVDYLRLSRAMHSDDGTMARRIIDGLRGRFVAHLRRGELNEARLAWNQIRDLKNTRNMATKGYTSLRDLIARVGQAGDSAAPVSRLRSLVDWKYWRSNFSNPAHYHTGKMLGFGPRLPAWVRMGKRTGKFAVGGALAAMLLHKMLGPSASDNFKK